MGPIRISGLPIFFFLFVAGHIRSQPEGFPSVSPLLKPELIRQLSIGQAHAMISVKYDNQPIRSSDRSLFMKFGAEGQPVRIDYVSYRAGQSDTVSEYYFYNGSGNCTTRVTKGYPSTEIEVRHYTDDRVTRISRYLVPQAMEWSMHLSPDRLVWSDSIERTNGKTSYYNQNGLAYKAEREEVPDPNRHLLLMYDQSGKLSGREETMTDKAGRIVEIQQINLNKHLFNWRRKCEYDSTGRLAEEHYFREGRLHYVRRISYLPNGLPELDLTRMEETGRIVIVKVSYARRTDDTQ